MKVVSAEQMQAIEQAAVAQGVTTAAMMARAGENIARAIRERWPLDGRLVVVLAGPGNNGGDGLVAARHLADAGAEVRIYQLKPRAEDDPELAQVRERGLFVVDAQADQRWRVLGQLVDHAAVIVDALLGTGARLPLEGKLAELLEQVRRGLEARRGAGVAGPAGLAALGAIPEPAHGPVVVAVDCPTGLDCDSGELAPQALPADLTVTMAFPKLGMFRGAGAAACGDVVVADIGLPRGLAAVDQIALELIAPEWVRSRLPARPRDAHKDTFGRVLIVAGSLNYTGAAVLAGEGAYRAGAGLVTLGVPGLLHAALAGRLPEATFLLLPHDQGALRQDAADVLRKELGPYRALLVGPGLGQDDATAAFVEALFTGRAGGRRGRMGFVHRDSGEPGEAGPRRARFGFAPGGAEAAPADAEEAHAMPALVVDADGLNLLARLDDWARRLAPGTVLTPHPGEMARLLKMEPAAVQADRLGTAERAAREWGHVVVLKGAYTVVAAPDGRVRIAPWARAGLARAGSGDVLAGAIAALLAQGLEPFDAAACGVYLHGLAGALAETELGAAGVLAGDIAEFMGDAVALVAGE